MMNVFSLHKLTVEQPVLVKTTGYAVHLFSYAIVPLLFSSRIYKPLHSFAMLSINEETFSNCFHFKPIPSAKLFM